MPGKKGRVLIQRGFASSEVIIYHSPAFGVGVDPIPE